MGHPRKTVVYHSEKIYTLCVVTMKEFLKQLSEIPLGDTLAGPALKDRRREYGQVEFTRIERYRWIVTLRKRYGWSAHLKIWESRSETILLENNVLGGSAEIIQEILASDALSIMFKTNSVFLAVKILHDCIIERCQTASQISRCYKEELLSELEKMFGDGLFTDFTLFVSGEEMRAHKNILAASSRYFAALLKPGTDRLEVNDSKPCTIRAILGYIYTGQVTKPDFEKLGIENYEDVDFYTDLLIAADKYQLDDLKSFCEGYICNSVSEESLDSLVLLTSRLNLKKLCKSIAKFASGRLEGRNTKKMEGIEEIDKIEEVWDTRELKETSPNNLNESESMYTFFYEVEIPEFVVQLINIQPGDTLDGPTVKDERRQYGRIEFTRVNHGWIVTMRNEFEGLANLSIRSENKNIIDTDGMNSSEKVIQKILTTGDMKRLLGNGTLLNNGSVLLRVKILQDHVNERCQIANLIPELYKEQLLSELEGMFNSGLFADFTLIISGEEIKAHKNILAASSRYFAALLKSNMIESQTDRLEVNDSKPSTIRAILGYIYTGQVTKPDFEKLGIENYEDVDFYTDLLIAADKYQLDDLKSFCEVQISNLVDERSMNSLIFLTSRLNLKKLRNSIAKFASD